MRLSDVTSRLRRSLKRNPPQPAVAAVQGRDVVLAIKAGLRGPLFSVAAFSVVISLLMLTIPIYMMQVFDRVLSSYSLETLVMLTLIATALLALLVALDGVRTDIFSRLSLQAEQQLAPVLLEAAVADHLNGRADAGQAIRDLAGLRPMATSPMISALFDAPLVPIFVILLFLMHPLLGASACVGVAGMIGLALANQWETAKRNERLGELSNALLKSADHQARNAEVIQAMGLLPSLTDRWREGQDHVLRAVLDVTKRGGVYQASSRFLRQALQVFLMALGAWLVISGSITAGVMFAASIIAARAFQPIEIAVGSWRGLLTARDSWKRIEAAVMRLPASGAQMSLPAPTGRIEIENVVVLANQRQILRGVSFTLAAGESLGIIGPSAAGKSTLARTMLGVAPITSGSVRLDGANIAHWPRAALGPHIGYLPQEVELFPGKVSENIARMGVPNPEAVVAAAKWVGIHDTILRLPQGYDTRIMAGGLMLTPGQRQRLALARAFYGNPKLVILDEPNSNLDAEGEGALNATLIEAQRRGVTVIVVAHRLGILRHVGKILVLRNGVVETLDQRDAVLAKLAQKARDENAAGTVVPIGSVIGRPGTP